VVIDIVASHVRGLLGATGSIHRPTHHIGITSSYTRSPTDATPMALTEREQRDAEVVNVCGDAIDRLIALARGANMCS